MVINEIVASCKLQYKQFDESAQNSYLIRNQDLGFRFSSETLWEECAKRPINVDKAENYPGVFRAEIGGQIDLALESCGSISFYGSRPTAGRGRH